MKRELTEETQKKILKMASIILKMHGKDVGNRVCQDWRGLEDLSPEKIFTKEELDDISFNFELYNSDGKDYDQNHNGMHDEMVASFTISSAIEDMLSENN